VDTAESVTGVVDLTREEKEMNSSWKFSSLINPNYQVDAPIMAYWEIDGSSMSGDHTPEEISPEDLFDLFVEQCNKRGEDLVPILWLVLYETPTGYGKPEFMPFQSFECEDKNFLTYFTWPKHSATGEPLNWLKVPVLDLYWRPGRVDKGGFIQEATGWKPSIMQPSVSLRLLAQAHKEWRAMSRHGR
jgi:hypothetical protein